MNKNSLKYKWLRLSTLIISFTYLIFSSLLIYFTSLYLKELEENILERSLEEVQQLYESQPINTLSRSDIISSLYDDQIMILYSRTGNVVETEPSNFQYADQVPFNPVSEDTFEDVETNDGSFLIGRAKVDSIYWDGYITVIHPLDNYNLIIRTMVLIALFIGFLSILFTSIISYFFSTQMVRPIRSIANQLKRIENEGFSERLKLKTGTTETDYMVDSFNNMMDTLEESYNQQKQFVEDASHELRTPLQIIQGHLKLIHRWGKNDPKILEESLDISIDELHRINKLVEELLLLTKNDGKHNEVLDEVNVNSEIESRVNTLQKVHEDYRFDMNLYDEDIYLKINAHHFEQMLIIFLDNAIKYDQEEKHIEVTTECENDHFNIIIKDHGIGIPEEDTENVFNRFYRVDKSRSRTQGGNGLGLSIAKKIVENYQGTVWVESEKGAFTKVFVRFPRLINRMKK
jgi:two-component system sensor histidine kinase ArlS